MIYTGASEDLEEYAEDILILSEKYELPDLKDKAVDVLRRRMAASNVARILSLADLHNAPDLKNEALEFMTRHHDEVKESESYKEFIQSYPSLLAELYDLKQSKKEQRHDIIGLTSTARGSRYD